MAFCDDEFVTNQLFQRVVPVVNERSVGRYNDGNRINHHQFGRGGNRPNRFHGARCVQNYQRPNNNGNLAEQTERQNARGRNHQGFRAHVNFNRRSISGDRNAMYGSEERLPGSGGGRRDHSAVRYRYEPAGGNASRKFEHRHDNGPRANGSRQGTWQDKKNDPRTANCRSEDGKNRGIYKQILGFKRLEDLATKEPEEILAILANSSSGFEDLLTGDLRPDLMILVVKVLAKVCNATFVEMKVTVLANACRQHFVDQLSKHVGAIPTDDNKRRKDVLKEFLEDLYTFCHTALNLLPVNACDVFPQLFCTVEGALRAVERYQRMPVEDKIKQFDELQNICVRTKKESEQKISKSGEVMQYQDPPNNYREINLYPNIDDIFPENDISPFIRPNIVKGSYENIEHYLDVQFRLLREDFVKPLREGIQEYRISKSEKVHRFGSVRFYPRVNFLGTKTLNNSVGLLVCFDPDKRMRNIKWEFCRRFMFGSLLCFSKDNFQSITFGRVLERTIKDLKEGCIVIDLCSEHEQKVMDSCDYKMIESEVYFEPYYHVMKALQSMTEDSFPMSQYIVHVQSHSDPPMYLRDRNITYMLDPYHIPVLEKAWPSSSQLNLDNSQYEAFRLALTKEFVIIQGPPGTGKTFIGLKVATVLLKNVETWNRPHTPILVICFTNHALDQFLEGLLEVTDNLVRVGGQSKSEKLQKFSLKERRQNNKRKRELGSLIRDQYAKISQLMSKIKGIQNDLDIINSSQIIISLSTFIETGIVHQHFNVFRENGIINDGLFLKWLTVDKDEFGKVDRRGEHAMNTQYPPQAVPLEENDVDDFDDDIEREDANVIDDDIEWRIDPGSVVPRVSQALALANLQNEISRLTAEINSVKETVHSDVAVYNKKWVLEDQLAEKVLLMNYLNMRLHQRQPEVRVAQRLAAHGDLMHLSVNERWIVYRYWVGLLQDVLMKESQMLGKQFRKEMMNMTEIRMMDDLEVMKDAHLVGMTTTGAARLQPLLQALKSKIVIVEEAAEVMESHIVVSLTNDCQHLILIGDHQQLRPTTADFQIAQKFRFNISLFERMLKNEMHCETLKVQHRMRPEIAQLIVPTIYPELYNDASVLRYEKIVGVEKSLFFITHKHPEDKVEDSSSRKNSHEGDFMIALCRYLLMQGYSSDQITVLATYSGQMFYLRSERRKYQMLQDVKMTVVDNFQGEENDIILLSLVRSNEEAKIGFLGIENRVCVALSRARKGLYIIGNMDNLTQSSEIWQKISSSLRSQQSLGEALTLRCQVHASQYSQVRTANDFTKNVPEGGCMQACLVLMKCGHECQRVCHIQDREHVFSRCLQECTRSPPNCTFYHKCPKRCWEDCGDCRVIVKRELPCGHLEDLMCHIDHKTYKCQVMVRVTLPHCGDVADKPCHKDVATFPCPHPCEDRLPCGHSCELKCHVLKDPDHLQYKCRKPCAKTYTGCTKDHKCAKRCHEVCGDCTVPVQRRLECGHVHKVACSKDPATVECRRDCSRDLPCGHKCKKLCYEKCGDCQEKVKKPTAVCGHMQSCKCCEEPEPKKCKGRCERKLPCGHTCTGLCRDPCNKLCMELVVSPTRSACGHAITLPCHMFRKSLSPDAEELLQFCQQPCGAVLQCEHKCKGTCGECLQGRIHMPCGEKCGRGLICGHSCEIPCAESCPPCKKKCTYRCKHSICSRKCGQPCIPCMEPCELGCLHMRCTKLCHEPCNITPCTRSCKKLLKCGHPCIGFCGDPCPPLCRVCDKDEVTEVFFGDEDEENARFVYLEDCKHTILGEGLDTWLQGQEAEISMKGCPKCKTLIMKTQRFANMIKAVYQDVVKVKEKVFGDVKAIEASREQLRERLWALDPSQLALHPIISGTKGYHRVYEKLSSYLQPVHKDHRNMLSIVDATTIRIQIDILTEMVREVKNVQRSLGSSRQAKLTAQLDLLFGAIGRSKCKITAQEVEDVNFELLRFQRLTQFFALEHIMISEGRLNSIVFRNKSDKVRGLLQSKRKYTNSSDKEVKALLEDVNRALKGGLNISDAERKEILAAVGVTPGHWFKCPNGHIYVITECGGAMEEGRCNECGERIGGGSHALLSSNALATEMDGARFAAWSNQQNMMNHDFNFID